MIEVLSCSSIHHGISHASSSPHSVSVGLPALAGRGKEQIPEGSMPDGSSIIHKLDEPSMGESGFSRRLPPLGGSGLLTRQLNQIANVGEPHVMTMIGPIRQVVHRALSRSILAGTHPGTWGPVKLTINGHRSSHGGLARWGRIALLTQQPMNAEPASSGILML